MPQRRPFEHMGSDPGLGKVGYGTGKFAKYPTAYDPSPKKKKLTKRPSATNTGVYSSVFPTHSNVRPGTGKSTAPWANVGTVDWKTGTYTGGTGFEAKPAGVNVGGTPTLSANLEKERARQQAARNLKTRIGTPAWLLSQYNMTRTPGWR